MRLALVLLVCLAPVARAQVPVSPDPASQNPASQDTVLINRPRTIQDVLNAQNPALTDDAALADRLLANGRTDEALALYEDLYAKNPEDDILWLKLREGLIAARRFDDAAALVQSRLDREPPSPDRLAELGTYLYQADRPAEADAAWERAVALAPDQEQTYRTVANALGALRLYDRAAAILEAGAGRLGDDPFVLERANLYGLALQYGRAADLYLSVVGRQPDAIRGVEARLARLLEGTGAREAFRASIDAALAREPLNLAYRELSAWLALNVGDYAAALDAVRAIDRLQRAEGRQLVGFAQTALAAGALDAAAGALDETLDRYPESPAAAAARSVRAQIADRQAREAGERSDLGPTPHADVARRFYQAAMESPAARSARYATALALADLERDVALDYDAASVALEIAAASPDPLIAGQAQLGQGEVDVRRGDLAAARERFSTAEAALQTGPLAEEARYEQALLDFYEGFPLSALARVEAMDDNTASDVSNDAIALGVTLRENADEAAALDTLATGPTPLGRFAAASLLHRRGLDADALAALDSLAADAPGHPLTDEILFLNAQTLRALRRPDAAVAALDRLAEAVPASFFRDRALVLQAEIDEHDRDDPAAAAERYRALLEQFPGSLFAPEARKALRRLRDQLS